MYKEDEEIDSHTLLQMWIGEGLVKSKQGTYLMDMAIGRKYLKLLVDRCLFQRVRERTDVFKQSTIKVHHCVRDMAVYIGQKEENCSFMASQRHQNFPQVHVENCSRISLAINSMEDLHTELRCPKLASLTLEENQYFGELPSEFLLGLTSLRVLNMSGCTSMASVPTSIGQLRMLEFLSLSGLRIKDLPEEICHLSGLQFLHLSSCTSLESLPSKIGELKNLKHLNLDETTSLNMIPREISELTSLSRLQLCTDLSVEMEAPASIWSLKGLKNLTELEVWIKKWQDGERLRIKDGIMGTWSEMRHLSLISLTDEMMEDLPQDMQNMKKLHSFRLWRYNGLSLPNCKFEHIEMVELYRCTYMKDLSCLEWLPNLKLLKLECCSNLGELGIGSPGRVPSGYLMLQKLVLKDLEMLESLAGPSNTGVWDERTLPYLRVLKIRRCLSLKRFPNGMEKLSNLCAIIGYPVYWWKSVIWEDDNTKIKFEHLTTRCR